MPSNQTKLSSILFKSYTFSLIVLPKKFTLCNKIQN